MSGSQSPGMRSPEAFGAGVCGLIAPAQIYPLSVPIIAKAQGKRHYYAAAYPKKPGAGRNDQIGSRKGSSHARDDDRYPSFNFAQHSRCGTGPEPAVSEPDDAATGIGRNGVPAGAGRSRQPTERSLPPSVRKEEDSKRRGADPLGPLPKICTNC